MESIHAAVEREVQYLKQQQIKWSPYCSWTTRFELQQPSLHMIYQDAVCTGTCTKQIRFGDLGSLNSSHLYLACLQYKLYVATYMPDFIWLKGIFFSSTYLQLAWCLPKFIIKNYHSFMQLPRQLGIYLATQYLSAGNRLVSLTSQLANNTYLVGQIPSQLFSLVELWLSY